VYNTKSDELKAIVETLRCITFFEAEEDREDPEVLRSCYGDPNTNQLIVKLEKGTKVFYDTVQSPLIVPPMRERIWGGSLSVTNGY